MIDCCELAKTTVGLKSTMEPCPLLCKGDKECPRCHGARNVTWMTYTFVSHATCGGCPSGKKRNCRAGLHDPNTSFVLRSLPKVGRVG